MSDDLLAKAGVWLARHDANPVGVVITGNLIRDLAAALREARAERDGALGREEFHLQECANLTARAERAEAERDRANALLAEARSSATHVRVMSNDLCSRIDAHLRGEEAGECPNCVTPWKCNGPHVGEEGLS